MTGELLEVTLSVTDVDAAADFYQAVRQVGGRPARCDVD
jgi:catechol 2,3-dioxygenase-like lactoylglutathione lyase family enzyme